MAGVSLSDIATEADIFPSQVTYYFGSKEALFVEAACRELLMVATEVERRGRVSHTPEEWAQATVQAALAGPGLATFIEAMVLARHRPDLAPLVGRTLRRLYAEGERAIQEKVSEGSWQIRTTPEREARAFWAAVFGVALEQTVMGDMPNQGSVEAVVLLVLNLHTSGE